MYWKNQHKMYFYNYHLIYLFSGGPIFIFYGKINIVNFYEKENFIRLQ